MIGNDKCGLTISNHTDELAAVSVIEDASPCSYRTAGERHGQFTHLRRRRAATIRTLDVLICR